MCCRHCIVSNIWKNALWWTRCSMMFYFVIYVSECSVMNKMLLDLVCCRDCDKYLKDYSGMHKMLHDVSCCSMMFHMSKDAIGCTWCSMMNHDVCNVFIALTSFQRFAELFEGLHLLMQCDAHIVVMFVMTIFKKCPFLLVLTSLVWKESSW